MLSKSAQMPHGHHTIHTTTLYSRLAFTVSQHLSTVQEILSGEDHFLDLEAKHCTKRKIFFQSSWPLGCTMQSENDVTRGQQGLCLVRAPCSSIASLSKMILGFPASQIQQQSSVWVQAELSSFLVWANPGDYPRGYLQP